MIGLGLAATGLARDGVTPQGLDGDFGRRQAARAFPGTVHNPRSFGAVLLCLRADPLPIPFLLLPRCLPLGFLFGIFVREPLPLQGFDAPLLGQLCLGGFALGFPLGRQGCLLGKGAGRLLLRAGSSR
jgi:hypothetical protein